jgi:N-acetylglucosamine-6-phosphate deacetylase
MATINPAKLIGCDTSKGSIEIDKDADFVIFDEAFNVKFTIIGGKKVYQA